VLRRYTVYVEGRAVDVDETRQGHLLSDKSLGEATCLGIPQEMSEFFRGLVAVHGEMGGDAFPAVKTVPLSTEPPRCLRMITRHFALPTFNFIMCAYRAT